MAEFAEIIKQRKRLCKGKRCLADNCPLNSDNNGKEVDCTGLMHRYPEEFEAIVMRWAEENPVILNKDKFKEIFGFEHNEICSYSYDSRCEDTPNCYKCLKAKFWEEEYKEPNQEERIDD